MMINLFHGKRILIVAGHYGSGKTEFAVSLAMALSKNNTSGFPRIAICDLDVVNPYFRSRERAEMLEAAGVKVCGGLYGSGSTAEIPEISPSVRAPLEDSGCFTIVDVGGNDSGARILAQFHKYFTPDITYTAAVINRSRPETSTVAGAVEQLTAIEQALGLNIDGLISNTHMITETTREHVIRGFEFCSELSEKTGKELLCVCYPDKYVSEDSISCINAFKMSVGMYMRQVWLDK
ncbi:MAG: hypothetical protein ACI3VB_04275 [Oscillospiraceae bacterium]